jgi:hypothetical protein
MEHPGLIEQLFQELTDNYYDVKTEAQLALALQNGLPAEDVVISCDNYFHREYSKDILFSEIKEDAGKKEYLLLHLTRQGLYDQLPEGLFYQEGRPAHQSVSALEMAAEYKINKKKEQEIRRFFTPFENDFFWQRIQLEKEETQLMEGFDTGVWNDYFIRFWGIAAAVPPLLVTRFIRLLPYAHAVSGHPEVMARCLATLLQEPVSVQLVAAQDSQASSSCIHQLGQLQLGMDMVLGDRFYEDYPVMEFVIGPLQHTPVTDYLEGGGREAFLEMFFRFFVPADADVVTRIEVDREKSFLVLQEDVQPVLGYSSVLCAMPEEY